MASQNMSYVPSHLVVYIECLDISYLFVQWNWSLTTARSPAVDTVYALAKARLPVALEAKLSEFPSAIINTHGKDLTVSADPSRSGTPAPAASSAAPSGAATPASTAAASKPAVKKPEAKAVNTATISVDGAFMASGDDLFSILTDEKRIPAWTRAPAQVSQLRV